MKIGPTWVFMAACLATCLALPPGQTQAQPEGADAEAASRPAERASMDVMRIPSHGESLNAMAYVAAGAGPHPAVILLHGFPGNERNLDLAQDMRRAGWDVLYFNYRGSWGTPGDFSFAHGIEDVAAVLAYVRQPENARRLRLDPTRLVLVGHSMGGFMAVEAASADPAVKGVALISAADLGGVFQQMQAKDSREGALHKMSAALADEGMAPLSGCTPDSLAGELADHGKDWAFIAHARALKDRPTMIATSDDGLADPNTAFATALQKAGNAHVTALHLPTDHAYSDKRVELSHALLQWLATLAK